MISILRAQTGTPANSPSLTFVKEFTGSVPAYYSITLREVERGNFRAEYRAAPTEDPTELSISPEVAQHAFSLAETLGWFSGPQLESGKKVAQMGKKTLRYENGSERNEVSYNHTELPEALELAGWFEKLSTTQQHIDRIDYLLRFDRLGIVKELLQAEMDLNQGRLLEPRLLLPALNKVLANKSLVNVAHDRATQIIARLSGSQ
ncbi:MAG: hypothetical protein EXQ56_13620 [Acidobacteria bacterium]|nr:hypothetical protein [Acidobacteriota bacterium]